MFFNKRNFVLVFFFLFFIGIFWSSAVLQELFQNTSGFIHSYIEKRPIVSIFAFIFLSASTVIISPLSSAPMVPFVLPVWGNFATAIYLFIGWVIGGLALYAAGRYVGYPLLSRYIYTDAASTIEYYARRLPKRADFLLVLLVRVALPSEIVSYILGIIRYHFLKYLAATLLVEFLVAYILVYIGDALIHGRPLLLVILIGASICIVGAAIYLLGKKIRNHRKNESI